MGKLLSILCLGGLFLYFPLSSFTEETVPATPEVMEAVVLKEVEPVYVPIEDPDSSQVYNLFPKLPERLYDSIFWRNQSFLTEGFDFPVGKPDGENYFKALKFGQRLHLGEDWNGKGGGNTDLGDPVYAVANGLVTFAEEVCCGWGNIVRVVHRLPNGSSHQYVESIYAHLHNIHVQVGDLVPRGEQLGSIGTAKGRYSAHLHFEMRDFINMSIGPGYSEDNFGYIHPTPFIEQHRPD